MNESERAADPLKTRFSPMWALEAFPPAAFMWNAMVFTAAGLRQLYSETGHAILSMAIGAFSAYVAVFYLIVRLRSSSSR
jgi:hypothetical protein